MSIWSSISGTMHSVGDSVSALMSGLTRKSSVPEKSVAFTIGMIALGAKMAKADGVVTRDEVAAFKQVFHVPEKDMAAVERVFNLAKQDVAGFEAYAQQVAKLFVPRSSVLENVLDGLFHIAKADNAIHEDELTYLERVAEIFGFPAPEFARIRSRHVAIGEDPWEILGLTKGSPADEVKARYRKLARELHPDKQMSKGVPAEMVKLSSERLARINVAYQQVMKGAVA
jgi:DnaJ like chaperone protein